jgi:hypothetical protein
MLEMNSDIPETMPAADAVGNLFAAVRPGPCNTP